MAWFLIAVGALLALSTTGEKKKKDAKGKGVFFEADGRRHYVRAMRDAVFQLLHQTWLRPIPGGVIGPQGLPAMWTVVHTYGQAVPGDIPTIEGLVQAHNLGATIWATDNVHEPTNTARGIVIQWPGMAAPADPRLVVLLPAAAPFPQYWENAA